MEKCKESCTELTNLFFGIFTQETLKSLQKLISDHNRGAPSFLITDHKNAIETGLKLGRTRTTPSPKREMYEAVALTLRGRGTRSGAGQNNEPYRNLVKTIRLINFFAKFDPIQIPSQFLSQLQSVLEKLDLDLKVIENLKHLSKPTCTLVESLGKGILVTLSVLSKNKSIELVSVLFPFGASC